jgi:hypothetical protein
VVIVGLGVVLVAVAGLGVQAVRGNRTVSVQRDAHTIHDAALDNDFYHCIDVQARSLVSRGESVSLSAPPTLGGLGNVVTLLKGVGSWATFADPPSAATVRLSLRNNVAGVGACLGTEVIGTYPRAHHGATVRVGSGSSVAGKGPPPAPPL